MPKTIGAWSTNRWPSTSGCDRIRKRAGPGEPAREAPISRPASMPQHGWARRPGGASTMSSMLQPCVADVTNFDRRNSGTGWVSIRLSHTAR